MHDIITVGLPLLAILAGILLNRGDAKDIRRELADLEKKFSARFDRTDARLDRIDTDLRTFYSVTGHLEGRLDEISKGRA